MVRVGEESLASWLSKEKYHAFVKCNVHIVDAYTTSELINDFRIKRIYYFGDISKVAHKIENYSPHKEGIAP